MGCWIVTGGASGIGAQIVEDLQERGENVIVWDANEAPAKGGAIFERVDLSDALQVRAAVKRVSQPVSGFLHCAGIAAPTSALRDDAGEQLRLAFETHVVSFVIAVQGLADRLERAGGSVVAIVSAAMDVIYPATLAYGTTKAALRRAINQLAVELAERKIRVNGIAPGAIATPMTQAAWSSEQYAESRRALIPLGRQAHPKSISQAALFLTSKAADYITGETIYVDGGVRHGIFNQEVRAFAGATPASNLR